MDLKPGYKQTDVGVIPEDWDVREVAKFATIITGPFGTLLKASEYTDGDGVPQISVGEIGDGCFRVDEHTSRIPPDVAKRLPRYLLRSGDVVFGRKGAVERSALVTEDEHGWFLGSDGISVRPAEECHPPYLAAQFRSREIKTWLLNNAIGTTMPSLNQGVLGRVRVAFAPQAEQSAIATALSDMEALLAAQDALIEKKRAIKQGVMQELLTGKRRLPGFVDEWKTKRLSEVLIVRHGKNQKYVEDDHGEFPILATGGQIGLAKYSLYDKPSVLIGRKGTIDRPQYMDTPFWTVDTLFFTEIKDRNNAKFFFYRFGLIDWMRFNEASGVPSLNARTIENIELTCPTPEEQAAIAAVLSDMDAEIYALDARRGKTALLKEGMMQELLTGKTRLVVPFIQREESTANVIPFKPSREGPQSVALATKETGKQRANVHFKRSVFAAEIVDQLHDEPTFGHVKFEKLIFLAEHICRVDTGSNYHRDAAGPYDNRALRSIDSQLKKQKWFDAQKLGGRYQYVPLEKHGGHREYFEKYYAGISTRLDEIVAIFRTAKTDQCEIVATLYGAWADLINLGQPVTDESILDQVLNHWHDKKREIPEERWRKALEWMREKGYVPEGAT